VDLPADACAQLLGLNFTGLDGEEITLQSNPGRFYACLGVEIREQARLAGRTDKLYFAMWLYRQAGAYTRSNSAQLEPFCPPCNPT
jgi:hypothetical protein